MATRTTGATREIEGRDSVGLYLDEIARNALLDAAAEVELSKTIEAGHNGVRECREISEMGEDVGARQEGVDG